MEPGNVGTMMRRNRLLAGLLGIIAVLLYAGITLRWIGGF